jgi:hypothetical protein
VVVVSLVALFGNMLDPKKETVSDVDMFVETEWLMDRAAALRAGQVSCRSWPTSRTCAG